MIPLVAGRTFSIIQDIILLTMLSNRQFRHKSKLELKVILVIAASHFNLLQSCHMGIISYMHGLTYTHIMPDSKTESTMFVASN